MRQIYALGFVVFPLVTGACPGPSSNPVVVAGLGILTPASEDDEGLSLTQNLGNFQKI
ncbi:MAG: hypothetical protein LBR11_08490 [Deltaproteobacteria bacterium]|jgi:hypothetical protein|nr:hypothetical protein [Deltaproteobacteria bacterium]